MNLPPRYRAALKLRRDKFHGEWSCTILPCTTL